jgi:hypothetical protein
MRSSNFGKAAVHFYQAHLQPLPSETPDGYDITNCGVALWLNANEVVRPLGRMNIASCQSGDPEALMPSGERYTI